VSGTVTSQAIGFPLAHGRRVVPSGRLLSSRIRLIGSLTAGSYCCFVFLLPVLRVNKVVYVILTALRPTMLENPSVWRPKRLETHLSI